MAEAERKLNGGKSRIDFQTDPSKYRHWKLAVDGEVATLLMDVDEKGTLFEGYELKLNSYDLGVDIELADAIERLRFEHPQVRVIHSSSVSYPALASSSLVAALYILNCSAWTAGSARKESLPK